MNLKSIDEINLICRSYVTERRMYPQINRIVYWKMAAIGYCI